MRYIFSYLLLTHLLFGGVFLANYYLKHNDYKRALSEYQKIENISDEVAMNIAYCLYRLHRYKEAQALYMSITKPSLNLYRYYNLANTLFQEHRYKYALKMYQNALKFKKDIDTLYNIKITKEMIKAQEIEEERKKMEAIRKGLNTPNELWDSNQSDKNLTMSDKSLWRESNNISKYRSSKRGDGKADIDNSIKKPKLPLTIKKAKISYRYYDKLMRKRALDTLLIPISKGEESSEYW